MRLNTKQFALASGVLWGVLIFLITLVAAMRGNGEHLTHLSGIYIGYHVSYLGSLIGLIYGFVSGLAAGALFSLVYNGTAKT